KATHTAGFADRYRTPAIARAATALCRQSCDTTGWGYGSPGRQYLFPDDAGACKGGVRAGFRACREPLLPPERFVGSRGGRHAHFHAGRIHLPAHRATPARANRELLQHLQFASHTGDARPGQKAKTPCRRRIARRAATGWMSMATTDETMHRADASEFLHHRPIDRLPRNPRDDACAAMPSRPVEQWHVSFRRQYGQPWQRHTSRVRIADRIDR